MHSLDPQLCISHAESRQRIFGMKEVATTELVPWKYCNPYANNRSPQRLFLFQGASVIIEQKLDEKVTIDQNTGNVVWDGAYLMARYLESNIGNLQGKTCLELGAGTGLVSIVAWLLGASFVLATDLPGPHTEHVRKNTVANTARIQQEYERLNQANDSCQTEQGSSIDARLKRRRDKQVVQNLDTKSLCVAPLDWNMPDLPDETPFQGPFSLILCSEILYLPQFHRVLLKTITKFADKDTIVVLLWKQRGLGEERFFDLASRPSSGWTVSLLDSSVLDHEFRDQTLYKPTDSSTETATFAAGCFWGVEKSFQKFLKEQGVAAKLRVGYTGGLDAHPTYKKVCSGLTEHAEAVQISFTPTQKTQYADLVEFFYRMHDPTTLNSQGPDRGTQYRSAIYTHSSEQEQIAKQVTAEIQEKHYKGKRIVTEITKAQTWYDAEEYHQKYLDKNPRGYECPSHYLRW
ncbi:Peptide-methionine (S)-S-oxide reductase [Podila epigama]|nr:Peptide-methionine (S)-S-oxide reductase [Podila epigama]